MPKMTVLGAGRIGRCIAELLRRSNLDVQLADVRPKALEGIDPKITTRTVDVTDAHALRELLNGSEVVISACQFHENPGIARVALETGASYFDLTEDVATTNLVRELSRSARPGQVFVPQCGLAPGFIGILGAHVASTFESIDTLKLRVGALPQMPNNSMLYNLTWSTEGLINEYCQLCDAIKSGRRTTVLPLEGLENFIVDGTCYEAFNTSGGLGTLCETLDGKVDDLTYKTIRYPGHRDLMNFLICDLKLGEEGARRELLMRLIDEAVPVTDQDVIVIFVSAIGKKRGKLVQQSVSRRILAGSHFDPTWSGIQITTAASACVAVDLHLAGQLLPKGRDRGFVAQEEIDYELFMSRPMAAPYAQASAVGGVVEAA